MTQDGVQRFPIRYSIQRWKDNLWFYGAVFVIMLVLTIAKLVLHQMTPDVVVVLILSGVLLVSLWVMRILSYVEVHDDGLTIRYVARRMDLPFASLARVRRQPLEVAFQPAERRRYVNRYVRRLAREPAAYIRIDRRQDGLIEEAERKLGPRLVAGADIVVPILNVDQFVNEMKSRLKGQGT